MYSPNGTSCILRYEPRISPARVHHERRVVELASGPTTSSLPNTTGTPACSHRGAHDLGLRGRRGRRRTASTTRARRRGRRRWRRGLARQRAGSACRISSRYAGSHFWSLRDVALHECRRARSGPAAAPRCATRHAPHAAARHRQRDQRARPPPALARDRRVSGTISERERGRRSRRPAPRGRRCRPGSRPAAAPRRRTGCSRAAPTGSPVNSVPRSHSVPTQSTGASASARHAARAPRPWSAPGEQRWVDGQVGDQEHRQPPRQRGIEAAEDRQDVGRSRRPCRQTRPGR